MLGRFCRRLSLSRMYASASVKVAQSINPATGKVVMEYPYLSDEQTSTLVEKNHEMFLKNWRKSSHQQRSSLLRSVATKLRANKEKCATMMTVEMGKAMKEALAEVEKCATICDYYAENAEAFLKPQPIDIGTYDSFVTFNALGPILIIMPWNYPFWQVFRQAACAISAGNTMLLKHASNVFGCAKLIEEMFLEGGFPEGVFTNLVISGSQASKVISNPFVRAVSITGSTPVGRQVAAHAATLLKKSVLELGGSDPYLILEDANLEHAAQMCTNGRVMNCGQSCIGAKRFLVTEAVYDEFMEKLLKCMKNVVVGDPMNMSTAMGPMVNAAGRAEIHKQVLDSVSQGAKIEIGGVIPEGPPESAFYPLTILSNVKKGMVAYEEELFGPVASVIKVKDEKEAIFVANDTSFGLGAAVFTNDMAKGLRIASEDLECGMAFVNDHVKSDPRLPFGGAKESGLGRECSHYGIMEFVNIKTVVARKP